jgi:pantoate--beta-alanine ligase
MSSRNVRLSPGQRKEAVCLYQALRLAEQKIRSGERESFLIISEMRKLIESQPTARIDYIKIVSYDSLMEVQKLEGKVFILLAVYFGDTRLIDNKIVRC